MARADRKELDQRKNSGLDDHRLSLFVSAPMSSTYSAEGARKTLQTCRGGLCECDACACASEVCV